jgi:hypothetical protein
LESPAVTVSTSKLPRAIHAPDGDYMLPARALEKWDSHEGSVAPCAPAASGKCSAERGQGASNESAGSAAFASPLGRDLLHPLP